ncbi:hypothetical protein [Sphingomonas sp. S2-65]|uniref:hypothetical protein n=1 Tax=Sphingomonas sp. S2-65 TaxID=2903960 RepID=UPI001F27C576|nr:hypothetical protein [Sphingomonas sp. S2-65]UYY59939.1 hypothetical protein LZ586_07600 [Sphingomonas sp. S2-65]
MKVVERVLNMRTGYVLDMNNNDFDAFIAREVGVDATAPRYAEDGESKAKRLRRILPSLSAEMQAKLLRAFLKYRDGPGRDSRVDLLDQEWRDAYEEVIAGLEGLVASEKTEPIPASSWTGVRTFREQIVVVRGLVPLASAEIDALARLVEERRFNDPVTADAVACLRELHAQLGKLLAAVDRGSLTKEAVAAIEANRIALVQKIREGAKIATVAPVMTLGLVHMLSLLTGVAIDSTMITGVFQALVAADVLKPLIKKSSLG